MQALFDLMRHATICDRKQSGLAVVTQLKFTPKAFANPSPWFEHCENPGN